MKILFFEPHDRGLYYTEFSAALKKRHDVFQYGPGEPLYNSHHTISDILEIYSRDKVGTPELILFGFGWENDSHPTKYNLHEVELGLREIKLPKAFIINKEYKKIDQKFQFIRDNKFDACFSVHHEYKKFEELTNTKFYRLPFAANPETFKDYQQEKFIDFGFSGNLFNSPYYRNTGFMGNFFNNIRERMYKEINSPQYSDLKIWWNKSASNYLYGKKYGRLINSSKIWLNTPSALEIVGTRFYEVMASHTLLFCARCDWAYKDLGLVDGKTCVMFEPTLCNFGEKLFYYLNNKDERDTIVNNAYELFLDQHTWDHRIKFLTDVFSECESRDELLKSDFVATGE